MEASREGAPGGGTRRGRTGQTRAPRPRIPHRYVAGLMFATGSRAE
jgi:hypothetical protein